MSEQGSDYITELQEALAHEKTMRAGAEHRAMYAEKTQQEYARSVERLRALIKAAEMGTENYCPWCNARAIPSALAVLLDLDRSVGREPFEP